MKYLGINQTKYVQELYEENYRKSDGTKKELNKWIDIPCSWIERLNIVESFLLKLIYRFNAIPIKIPPNYLVDIDELILKFIWRGNRPRKTNAVLKENKVGGLTLLDIKNF